MGALNDILFTDWINNDLILDATDYYSFQDGNYIISSINDFKNLLGFVYNSDYSFLLNTNIDLSEDQNFYIPYFNGSFNGNNYTISNLYINRSSTHRIGLFGWVEGSTIKNVGVTDVSVTGASSVGSLLGSSYTNSNISNCYSTGNVTGTDGVGGLVGYNYSNSNISNCYSTGNVTGENYVGGFIGINYDSNIINCFSTCSVIGEWWVGRRE